MSDQRATSALDEALLKLRAHKDEVRKQKSRGERRRIELIRNARAAGAGVEQVGDALGVTKNRISTLWKSETGTGWRKS